MTRTTSTPRPVVTDPEISKALALAIGWRPCLIAAVGLGGVYVNIKRNNDWANDWRAFDYRDWNVIAPIAEKFDCFPLKIGNRWAAENRAFADTPQKAIALAVIKTGRGG